METVRSDYAYTPATHPFDERHEPRNVVSRVGRRVDIDLGLAVQESVPASFVVINVVLCRLDFDHRIRELMNARVISSLQSENNDETNIPILQQKTLQTIQDVRPRSCRARRYKRLRTRAAPAVAD